MLSDETEAEATAEESSDAGAPSSDAPETEAKDSDADPSVDDADDADAAAKEPAAEESAAVFEYRQQVLLWSMEQIREEFRHSSWSAFWETAVEGRDVADVSAELEISPGAIYMARSRVMSRLREKSKEFDIDDEAVN